MAFTVSKKECGLAVAHGLFLVEAYATHSRNMVQTLRQSSFTRVRRTPTFSWPRA
ncbi:hypothetical protein V1289_003185 [Bradyrhizobium sp. AZCC 2289]